MKLLCTLSILITTSCYTPTYLVSTQLQVTGIANVDGHQVVEVCGINNKGQKIYSYIKTSHPYQLGDTIVLK